MNKLNLEIELEILVFAVQSHAEINGYGVVRELVGHGFGRSLHEKPEVPNYGKKEEVIK